MIRLTIRQHLDMLIDKEQERRCKASQYLKRCSLKTLNHRNTNETSCFTHPMGKAKALPFFE